jgi:hypothetical protein
MSVGTASLPHHPGKVGPVDLRELELGHDNVKLDFTESISHGLGTIGDSYGSTTELFEEALHNETRDGVILTNQNVQWTEEWAILNIELGEAPRALAAALDLEQGLSPGVLVIRGRR